MRILSEDFQGKLLETPTLRKPNKLIKEKSPYLLQHAHNPVDWYPWGEEAFEKAKKEDKPIFLSIGYSTCYWCHVMEREVFENRSIADFMNLAVVSIKVDREERPDIDQIYMSALQAMTGSGGWPMSIFMTPDRKPFFAATYIPPKSRPDMLGFMDTLNRINKLWINDRDRILENSEQVFRYLTQSSVPKAGEIEITESALENGFAKFSESYDAINGGFGIAPKFPRPSVFNFLFRYFYRTGKTEAAEMALDTLRKMAAGGMYDHIGGGFHRYSTDERWHLPHFEKMLYDQAQLVISYLEAYQITHEQYFARIARETLSYVQRVLTHPEGGFYCAEDAESLPVDSQSEIKKEGAYYTWKKSEIEQTLSEREAKIVEYRYGIEEDGNVDPDPRGEFHGENVLHVAHSIEEIAGRLNERIEDVQANLDLAKMKLFESREKRRKPSIDDKVLLSWNSLMISAFARASQILGETIFLDHAISAAKFLLNKLYKNKTGLLLRRYRDGEARYEAHLSDYAFFIQALIDLYEASFEIEWLQKAVELAADQVRLFYDDEVGGFYEVSGGDPTILVQTKEINDGAEPSANSITILNLLRLTQMIDINDYWEIALKSIKYFSEQIHKSPQNLPQLLVAVDSSLSESMQFVFAGDRSHMIIADMLIDVHSRYLPNKVILFSDGDKGQEFLAKYVPFFEAISSSSQSQRVYICDNFRCELPMSELRTMMHFLDKRTRKI